MGNCCGGRDDAAIKNKAAEGENAWDTFFSGQTGDVAKFDAAYRDNDIPAMVALIPSKAAIKELDRQVHPWAATPRTVGALSLTNLSILASDEKKYPGSKDSIREAGALPLMIKELESEEVDRVDSAAIALSFLSVDNTANCIAMFEAGAMRPLVHLLMTGHGGMQGATAQACRNIYVLDRRYRDEFVKVGGIVALAKMLNAEPVGEHAMPYNQMEACYHFEDLILDGGEELPELIKLIKQEGILSTLEKLLSQERTEENKEIIDAAEYLHKRLAD